MMSVSTGERRTNLIQGDFVVSSGADVVLTTILGSCVAACIRDPGARVGGMNHFLLPRNDHSNVDARAQSYGVHLMELLVNGLMQQGARRDRLEAKLFGGARLINGLADIGANNAGFARRFIEIEGIKLVSASLGGAYGRRIQYWPVSGRARQCFMDAINVNSEPLRGLSDATRTASGELELF